MSQPNNRLEWTTVQRKVNDLVPAEVNPRKISEAKLAKLIEALTKFNVVGIPAIDHDGTLLNWHQRLKAMQAMGRGEELIDVRMPNRPLTDKERKEYILLDNQHYGEWDEELLPDFMEDLDMAGLGFEEEDFKSFDTRLAEEEEKHKKPERKLEAKDDDFVPPAELFTDIVLGDLFEFRKGELRHRLLCGDSTDSDAVERLMDGEKADFVFTSPPYNTGGFHADAAMTSENFRAYPYLNDTDKRTQEEYLQFNKDIFGSIYLATGELANVLYNISYNQNSPYEFILIIADAIKSGLKLHETIIWKKTSATPLRSRLTRICEFVFVLSKDASSNPPTNQQFEETRYNFWEISNANSQSKEHGAAFPVELANAAILGFCTGVLIFEPFNGSGTTMVAAHQLERNCYCMEIDPKYCQITIDRMRKLDPALEITRNGQPI
jgi:DNA modification methylase